VDPAGTDVAEPAPVTVIETRVGVVEVPGDVLLLLRAPPHPERAMQNTKANPNSTLILFIS
jgi:hypothetical protein